MISLSILLMRLLLNNYPCLLSSFLCKIMYQNTSIPLCVSVMKVIAYFFLSTYLGNMPLISDLSPCFWSLCSEKDMDAVLWYGISTIIALISFFFLRSFNDGSKLKLPPGPFGMPLIGNILDFGTRPNESLTNLSKKYGDIMTLRLGFTTTIVVSSPSMAKEILKNNDHMLAGRAVRQTNMAHSHCYSAFVFSQCNSHWRRLRRISNTNLFTVKKLESLHNLRELQMQRMMVYIKDRAHTKLAVDIGQVVFTCSINVVGNMVFGKDMFHPDSPELEEFRETVRELVAVHALPNFADYFPFLSPFDPQGVKRRATKAYTKIYSFLEALVNERIKEASDFHHKEDLLGALLQEKLSLKVIRNYISDLFVAGSDTVSTLVEWTMAELVKNPNFQKRAQQEIDSVVGTERAVHESDLERFDFLKAIVKESMRLHPPAPLLVPHRADDEVEIAGKYRIPKHAQIVVNVWAMGRDTSVWSHDAEKFNPDRFSDSEIDYKGQHFELIPFGSGRRMCVALPLATRMVHSFVALLLHSFDWSLPNCVSSQDLDMSDKFGITLQKVVPLQVVPHFRLSL